MIATPAEATIRPAICTAPSASPKSMNASTATTGVTNLTNKAYIGSGNSSLTAASGYAEVTYGPPRMFTVEGTINF